MTEEIQAAAEEQLANDQSLPQGEEIADADSQDSETENDSAVAESLVELEINGKIYQVTPEIKDGYLRHADYTQKTQSLAEQRKQVEVLQKQAREQFEGKQKDFNDIVQAQMLSQQLERYNALDWNTLTEQNPIEAIRLEREFRALKDQRDQLVRTLDAKSAQRAAEEQARLARQLQEAQAVITREIKGWSPEVAKQLTTYGVNNGFSDEELGHMNYDPRVAKILHKAWLYDQTLQRATKPQNPNQPASKPITQLKGGNPNSVKDPSKMTDSEYEKWRRQRISKK